MSLELSDILMIVAILVEGPIVWWLTSRQRKEDNMGEQLKEVRDESRASLRKLHERIDEVEDKTATKDFVEDKIDHVKEVVNVQFSTIMENLSYIRKRVDERTNRD